MHYTVHTSFSGVSYVYFNGNIFCAVHHIHAGSVSEAIARAENIANVMNNLEFKID
jgi:hypothetical protein